MYYEKIDSLFDIYVWKLVVNMNKGYEIDVCVFFILIVGGFNFFIRKKEKQNVVCDSNYWEWQDIQGFFDKICSIGMGGISVDDLQVVQKLEKKLESFEKLQEIMKVVNVYYCKYKIFDGCLYLLLEQFEKLKVDMVSSWYLGDKFFVIWVLFNNSVEIWCVKDCIKFFLQ